VKRFMITFCAVMLVSGALLAQTPDSTAYKAPEEPEKEKQQSGVQRVYYGGYVGFSFGDYTRISFAPLVGFRLTRMWSAGVKAAYEYVEDKRYSETVTSHNYGGSFFARLRPHPRMYLHGEFAYMSYEYQTASLSSEREWVPFLLLGGGIVQPISKKASAFIEVLFDVLQDENSPYADWDPWISIGVSAGF